MNFSVKKVLMQVILLQLLVFHLCGQTIQPLTIDAHKDKISLLNHIALFEDRTKISSIDDIIQNDSLFQNPDKNYTEIYLTYSNSDYWIKFSIHNNSPYKGFYLLTDNNPRINYNALYANINDSIVDYYASGSVLFNKNVQNKSFIAQLTLYPNQLQTYYLNVSNEGGPINLNLELLSPFTFLRKVEITNTVRGIYYGILATILFTSLLIWLSSRKTRSTRYNFWFFFYVVMITIFSLGYDGYLLQLFNTTNVDFKNLFIINALLISFIAIANFITNYFNARKTSLYLKRIFDVLISSTIMLIVLFNLFILSYKTTIILTFIIAYSLIVASVILAIKNYRNTPRFTIFFITAVVIINVCISILFIHMQSGYLSNELQDIAIKTGFASMLILLTIGLSIRMRIQREKAYLQMVEDIRKMKDKEAKINQELELEVKRRTKQLVENQTKLEEANKAINKQKEDLELAFKKSSKQHVKLQKALRLINEHRDSLEKAFKKSSSQHVKLQKALRLINEQKAELEKANEEIKESSRLKEIFLANTSHEIRTPLNAIIGFTNLLAKTKASQDQARYIKNIKSSGENLLVIINDILDFSKIEAGKLSFESINFNVYDLVDQLFDTLQVKAVEKGVLLDREMDDALPQVLIGDPYRLNQMLINLIGNSIKFTNKGGKIILKVKVLKIENDTAKVQFLVSDTGIGISKEKLKNIFQSFTQAESDTTRKYGGTGLGLSIVKQLVELQNGSIDVQSEINKGTTFTFILDFETGSLEKLRKYSSTEITSEDKLLDGITLLLVEDNEINQQLAVDTIESWEKNIRVHTALDGFEAIELLKKNEYSLILMDIQMPGMDGIEATRKIRSSFEKHKRNVPIIAMTAHAMKEERETCQQIGMNDYITKPFNPDDLYRKILFYSINSGNSETTAKQEDITQKPDKQDVKTKHKNQLVNLDQLHKIYKQDNQKISKILKLYLETVPSEIEKLNEEYSIKNWDKLKNTAHTLKTKMGYLGLSECKRMLSKIEKNSNDNPAGIDQELIKKIDDIWNKAKPEIEKHISKMV